MELLIKGHHHLQNQNQAKSGFERGLVLGEGFIYNGNGNWKVSDKAVLKGVICHWGDFIGVICHRGDLSSG